MWNKVVVLFVLTTVTLAAVSIGPHDPKPPKYQNIPGCYIKALDRVISFGSSAPAKDSCLQYRCSDQYIEYVTCGAVHVSPSQKLVQDLGKPYPECCPRLNP